MRLVKCLDRLQFDQDRTLDHQVHEILTDHCTVVCDGGATLLRNGEPASLSSSASAIS